MYRSRKATAVFQHTNPLKEERFMKEWQVSKWSPLTKVYTQYNTWRMMSTPGLGLFIPPFTPQLIWGRRGQGTEGSREQAPWHGAGYRGTPEGTEQPVRVVAHNVCTVTPPASMPLGTAWNSCQTSAGSGSWGRSPEFQYWEALVYHLSKNFSMYSSARLESLH